MNFKDSFKKTFLKDFHLLTQRHSPREVWDDFIMILACDLAIPFSGPYRQERKVMQKNALSHYSLEEYLLLLEMGTQIILAFHQNSDQDFLGPLYMDLKLGNARIGQFFTTYSISRMIAAISINNLKEAFEKKQWVSISDPACGSGGMLIAAANCAHDQNILVADKILFVAQDISYIVALTCYVQLSLLGYAAIIIIGDTLLDPPTTQNLQSDNVWYTPGFFIHNWHQRNLFDSPQD